MEIPSEENRNDDKKDRRDRRTDPEYPAL